MSTPTLELVSFGADGLARVAWSGPLSLAGRPPGDPLEALLGPRACARRVVLDLSRCRAFDTGGLAWLLRAVERHESAGGRFVVLAPPPALETASRILGLARLLPCAADADEADAMAARPAGAGAA